MTRLPLGAVAVRLRLFRSAKEELMAALKPPWPEWMTRLYGLEHLGEEAADPEAEETTVSAAILAVGERLAHRLKLAGWVVSAMVQIGWEPTIENQDVVLTKVSSPELAAEELEAAGVLGPMTKLADLAGDGRVRLYEQEVP